MAPPQGYFTYPRMAHFLYGSFALAHGVQPSICRITAAAQPGQFAETGTLGVHYGSRSFAFDDCHLKNLSETIDDTGRKIALLTIEDRRWRWRGLGRISGYYNQISKGSNLKPKSKRSLKQLIALVLKELKETKIDVSRVDNSADHAPTIDWDYEEPVVALAQLLEYGRLRISLRPDGGVAVYPRGVGQRVEINSETILASRPIESPDRPTEIVVAMGRTEIQATMRLKAVALNRRLEWVKLDEVEYKPPLDPTKPNGPKGWGNTSIDFTHIEDPYDRELAERSVYRAYQVETPFSIQALKRRVEDLEEILPLQSVKVETRKVNGVDLREPATVFGSFFGGYDSPEPKKKNEQPIFKEDKDGVGRYARGFRIIEEDGVVLFDEPLFQRFRNGVDEEVIERDGQPPVKAGVPRFENRPANLVLTTSFNIREKEKGELRGWVRHEEKFPVGSSLGGGTRSAYIVNDARRRAIVDGGEDNEKELREFANLLADTERTRLNFNEGRMVEYAGFYSIFPDGLVAQSTFTVASDGKATMETLVHIEDTTDYQTTRDFLAQMKADREASVLRSIEQRIVDAQRRAL